MDAWTQLLQHLQDPLCQDEDSSEALLLALRARREAPRDCQAPIREHLSRILATASDARILTSGPEVARRLSARGDAVASNAATSDRQRGRGPVAQDVDRTHGCVIQDHYFFNRAHRSGPEFGPIL